MLFEILFCFDAFDGLDCIIEVFRGGVLGDDAQFCEYTLKKALFWLLYRILSFYHAAIELLSC